MTAEKKVRAIVAAQAPLRAKPSNYPEAIAKRMVGRHKQPLGNLFGLTNFGVNRTRLEPGAISALRHAHSLQDELVYVLEGHPTLVTDAGEMTLSPGMCAGFKAGDPDAHQFLNRTSADVILLEIGDRTPNDQGTYPDDDLKAGLDASGQWTFHHKDGTPY